MALSYNPRHYPGIVMSNTSSVWHRVGILYNIRTSDLWIISRSTTP